MPSLPHRNFVGVAFVSLSVLAMSASEQASRGVPPVAAPGAALDLDIVRIKLGDVPAELTGKVDPCAIDRAGDERYAVLFLPPSEVAELTRRGIPLERRGKLGDHFAAFAPLNTLSRKGIPSIEEYPAVRRRIASLAGRPVPRGPEGPCADPGTLSLQPYDEYHTLAEGVCFMQNLANAFPEIIRMVSIGQTLEGRDIWALKVTDNPDIVEPDEERILFTGVTHAREWATHEVMLYMAEQLTSGYASDPQTRRIVNNAVVWLVPVVNPDGFEYSWTDYRMQRKNRHDHANCNNYDDGVDINRNYAYNWGPGFPGSSGDPCSEIYRGDGPASELETQAIQNLLGDQEFAISVSYHTYSQLVLYPWGYTRYVTPESYSAHRAMGKKYADLVRATHGAVYTPGQGSYAIYLTNGSFDDYAYGAHGALSFTPELRPESWGGGGFLLPEEEILPNNEENMSAAWWLMINVAGAMEVENPASETLIESPGGGPHAFSLALTPLNQHPDRALNFPTEAAAQLQTWLNDADHDPPYWGSLNVDQSENVAFEGCGAGSGYRLTIDDPTLAEWADGLTSYKVLPYVFEDGAEVMLSNYVSSGMNVIGIPASRPVHLGEVSIVERVMASSGGTFGYGEVILEERTTLEDLQSPDPWIDWDTAWQYRDSSGDVHLSHPTGQNGASEFVQPFRAYEIRLNVPSWDFGSSSVPVYLLRFPTATVDCNRNGVLDSIDVSSGESGDCNANDVPDECEDCNNNGIADECDIADQTSDDCNTNGIPDECIGDERDCNANDVPDACDVLSGGSDDCNGDNVPDECVDPEDDCNLNANPDECDISDGASEDCNTNATPDECEPDAGEPVDVGVVAGGASLPFLPGSLATPTLYDNTVVCTPDTLAIALGGKTPNPVSTRDWFTTGGGVVRGFDLYLVNAGSTDQAGQPTDQPVQLRFYAGTDTTHVGDLIPNAYFRTVGAPPLSRVPAWVDPTTGAPGVIRMSVDYAAGTYNLVGLYEAEDPPGSGTMTIVSEQIGAADQPIGSNIGRRPIVLPAGKIGVDVRITNESSMCNSSPAFRPKTGALLAGGGSGNEDGLHIMADYGSISSQCSVNEYPLLCGDPGWRPYTYVFCQTDAECEAIINEGVTCTPQQVCSEQVSVPCTGGGGESVHQPHYGAAIRLYEASPAIVHGAALAGETRPFSGYIDPRRESTDGTSANQGLQEAFVRFTDGVFACDGSDVAPADFTMTETGAGPPPVVDAANYVEGDRSYVQVHWNRPVTLKQWTTLRANVCDASGTPIVNLGDLGPGVYEPDRVDIGSLPGDVDQNRLVAATDLIAFREYATGGAFPARGGLEDFVDINRGGELDPFDLLAFRQLVNGVTPATQGWLGQAVAEAP